MTIAHQILAFPSVIMGFDLQGAYDPDQLVDEEIVPHALMGNAQPGDGSSSGKGINYLHTRPEVKLMLQNCVDEYTNKMSQETLAIANSWINRASQGTFTNLHRHEGSVISGAFYPKVEGEGSSPLILHTPLAAHTFNTFYTQDNDLNASYCQVPATQGMLWLFPSWLNHHTEPTQTNSRWVISFNTYPRERYTPTNLDTL